MQFSRVFKKMAKYMLFLRSLKKGLPTQKHPGEGAGLIATRSATRDRRPAPRKFSHNSNPISYQGEGPKVHVYCTKKRRNVYFY